MQLTAAVINAGLGDLTLGLQMSGFHVIAAFEVEEKSIVIHKKNLNVPLYQLPLEEIDPNSFPNVDLLAAHLYHPSHSRISPDKKEFHDNYIHRFRNILFASRPRAFFLLINVASIKNDEFRCFLEDTIGHEYNLAWKLIDVAQMTGFPVRENAACVVGVSRSIDQRYEFPSPNSLTIIPISKFIAQEQSIDPWYYRVRLDSAPVFEDWHQVLCCKNHTYEGTDFVHLNFMQIPLIRYAGELRRITHREIANLKGYPANYDIFCKDRQWLYKKLIYSGNIILIQQIAGMINYTLSSNPWRDQRKERGAYFEQIFGSYLESIKENASNASMSIEYNPQISGIMLDYAVFQGDRTFYFKVQYTLISRATTILEQLSNLKALGIPIFIIAAELSSDIKKSYFDKYGVHIWDIENLLWLFDEFPDIKNELIAFLDYATDHIEPKAPLVEISQKPSEQKTTELDLKERLLKITPSIQQSRDHESLCIEILKYVLGDYLTLWDAQETTNDGLYRFDLCCKIKNGANQDFFDTVKHYFNTKYIIFEFKNYTEKITQKEIYTTEKYLYEKALRKVAIIISRFGADNHALKAAKGVLRENGKLILCLSDNSLLEMIEIKTRGDQEPAEFLGAILDDILVHLEK